MKKLKNQYYWVIAVIILIQHMVSGGINNNLPSLFLVPVTQQLGITRGAYSLAFSLKGISAMISTALSGGIMMRYGYRKSVLVSLMIALGGMTILSFSGNGAVYALGCVVLGLGDGICVSAGAAKIVSSWFYRRKGAVLGLVTAGTGIGGSITCILLSDIIERNGWRSAYLCSAALIAAVLVMLFLLVKNHPEEMGLQPYGFGNIEKRKKVANKDWWPGFSMKEMTKKPLFYMMCVGTFLSFMCATMVLNVMVAHLQDRGVSTQDAVAMQSVLLLLLAGFKFIFGVASDRLGARPVMLLCLGCTAASLVAFALISSPAIAWVAIIIYAASLPITSVMVPLLSTSLFGYQAQTSCVGIFFATSQIASIVTAPIANLFYDKIGSYTPVFLAAAVVSVFLVILYLIMYKLSDTERKILSEE